MQNKYMYSYICSKFDKGGFCLMLHKAISWCEQDDYTQKDNTDVCSIYKLNSRVQDN